MAAGFYLTNAVVQGMLNGTGLAEAIDAGTAAVIEVYSGTVPTDADASIGSAVLLVSLTCSATAFSGFADANPGGRATFGTITSGTAVATGTAAFYRIKTQTGGTVICQGTVGTSSADLVLNNVAIVTSASVSISSGTITLPEGP